MSVCLWVMSRLMGSPGPLFLISMETHYMTVSFRVVHDDDVVDLEPDTTQE